MERAVSWLAWLDTEHAVLKPAHLRTHRPVVHEAVGFFADNGIEINAGDVVTQQFLAGCVDALESAGVAADVIATFREHYLVTNGAAKIWETVVTWPTVEWVKVPVDVRTGLPNGSPIAMRHFADCDHWFRHDDGSWVGEPPFLASDEQMASLPACKDCTYKAEHSGNERVGPRLGTTLPETAVGAPDVPLPVLLDLDETDVTATVRVRREQSHLRKHLFAGETERKCALCGRLLPSSLLVAAHIVPRRNLDDAQRLDFASAAMLACALGCDTLFELGYVVVRDDGTVVEGKCATGALADAVGALGGRRCGAFNENTAANFHRHAELHAAD